MKRLWDGYLGDNNMKKIFKKTVILLGTIPIISSCKTSNINQTTNKPSTSITSSITSNTTKLNQNKFPSELKEIPNNYYNPIEQKGTLVDFYYNPSFAVVVL